MSGYSALRIFFSFFFFFTVLFSSSFFSRCRVSLRGRCHVWPCRTEFSGVAKSYLLHSPLNIFPGCVLIKILTDIKMTAAEPEADKYPTSNF